MPDILFDLQDAFNSNSVPKKNIALRKAFDEIVRLRNLASDLRDDADTLADRLDRYGS